MPPAPAVPQKPNAEQLRQVLPAAGAKGGGATGPAGVRRSCGSC
jgi:hypothetical protein